MNVHTHINTHMYKYSFMDKPLLIPALRKEEPIMSCFKKLLRIPCAIKCPTWAIHYLMIAEGETQKSQRSKKKIQRDGQSQWGTGLLWADSDNLGFCSCWHLRGRGLVYTAIFLGMALDCLRDTAELQDMHIYYAKPFLVNAQPKVGGLSIGCPKVGDTKYKCLMSYCGSSCALFSAASLLLSLYSFSAL